MRNKLITFLLLLSAALQLGSTCIAPKSARPLYSFLDGHLISPLQTSAPVLLKFEEIYQVYGDRHRAQADENIQEWYDRYCSRASAGDIYEVVYAYSLADMEYLYSAAAGKQGALDSYLRANSFARYLVRNKCLETIRYLQYAKRCQPHVVPGADPWKKPIRDKAAMQGLIREAREQFLTIESDYIRLRYAYQMIRLAHYAGDYPLVLELYNFLMPKIDHDPSVVEYWIKGHLAGAKLALGNRVEAAYLYAQVFDRSRGKAETAFRSFRIRTDAEWEQCLLLCQSDRERAALFALRASAQDSKAADEMEKIYALNPANAHLEVLLVREIQQLERDFLGASFRPSTRVKPRPDAGRYLIRLQQLVRRILEEGQVPRRELWLLADGYLEVLAGNYVEADRSFRVAGEAVSNDTLRAQLNVFRLALRISGWQQASPEVEEEAFDMRNGNRFFSAFASFPAFLRDKLVFLYQQQQQPGKAFLLRHPPRLLGVNPDADIIDELITLCGKPQLTRLEEEMLGYRSRADLLSDLLHLKGTLHFAEGRLEAALETYKQIDPARMDGYGRFNPFPQRFRECIHCPMPDAGASFNKRELVSRLLEMEYRAKAGVRGSDTLYYELGLAWYNMSYFGHAWRVLDAYRSGASMALQKRGKGTDFVFPHPELAGGNRENMDCSRALGYFEQALQLAGNPEYAAMAAFMAAKCERNMQDIRGLPPAQRSRQYFELLRTRYANTTLSRRMIHECKYFDYYVSRR